MTSTPVEVHDLGAEFLKGTKGFAQAGEELTVEVRYIDKKTKEGYVSSSVLFCFIRYRSIQSSTHLCVCICQRHGREAFYSGQEEGEQD